MELLKESEDVISFKSRVNGLTVKEFLFNKNISGRLFRKLNREENIYLNGKKTCKSEIVNKNDIVSLIMDDEKENIIPQNIPLNIIYEDFDLLVLNKQPHIVVHPTKSHIDNTIANGINYYYSLKNINKKVRFVNRLDMNTSGLVIVAKNPYAHHQIGIQLQKNKVQKKYIAVVEGVVKNDREIIDLPIGREEEKSIKKVVTVSGKRSITEYKVLKRYSNNTLLEVQIFTGRSHQIRVHLEHIGHPIIGDTLYNKSSNFIDRQALHAYYISLVHPRTNKKLEFKAELPQDMEKLLISLEDPSFV